MKHFPDDAWIDFVRGVASSDTAQEMESHLDACAKCREIHAVWGAVFEIARREGGYEPSERATRQAKAMFSLRSSLNSPSRAAQLIFDSFRAPLMEGIRHSHATGRRQLQYQFGTLLIDIELSRELGDPDFSTLLAGQISSRDETHPLQEFRVFLMRGMSFTAQVKGSRLGEFHFELADGKNWKLLFDLEYLESQEILVLSLPDVTSSPSRK